MLQLLHYNSYLTLSATKTPPKAVALLTIENNQNKTDEKSLVFSQYPSTECAASYKLLKTTIAAETLQ